MGRRAALAAGAVAGVVLVALAGCAFVQVGYWRDSATVFQRAMQAVPGNYFAYHEYGVLMSQRGYLASGRTYFQEAVAIRPDWGPGHNTLARAYLQSGDYAAAWREVRLARRHGFEPSPRMIQRLSAKMPAPE